ncbi:SDR family NAD(P)-dependent oxidoreductase, partial [Psychrobacter sp. SMN/5/1215-MNA-CIBAN-0208]|uniref:SDR family NAD(P)-dependent oxidoreductase n=1 Tax=Psychrobacter sp. SMN/5/1215-MNA-CIBAN-0208 TaxID=3140442 RepID=UPI00332CE1D1
MTGAASGIGFETAKQLIQKGSNLVLFDVQSLDEAVSALQAMNKNDSSIATYKLDVTDAEMTTKQMTTAADILAPDILMHFVGITGPWTFDDMSQEQFERVMTIN